NVHVNVNVNVHVNVHVFSSRRSCLPTGRAITTLRSAFGRCGMGWGKVRFLMFVFLVACVDKKQLPPCDPDTDSSCSVASSRPGCTKDSDCGDGVCMPDGTCKANNPVDQPTACASVSCPAGQFCSNGQCLPENAQCQQADPACIFIPHGAFQPP